MTWFDKLIPRLVAGFAIKSWRDLVLKLILFFVLVNAVSYLSSVDLFSSVGALGWASEFWVIFLAAAPVLVFQMSVVTYLSHLQRRFEGAELRDALTGLPNRLAFISRTKTMRLLYPQGVMALFDADNFERINDVYGHAFGDQCLRQIAEVLRENTTDQDVIGRLSGTEFAAFIPVQSKTDVKALYDTMSNEISLKAQQTHAMGGRSVRLTMSVGVVQAGPHHSIDLLLSRADTALYCAKDFGRGRIVLWEDVPSTMRQAS